MYLRRIRARNFRAFGDGTTAPELNWVLNAGLNILVGENDAGKTGIVGATGGKPTQFVELVYSARHHQPAPAEAL